MNRYEFSHIYECLEKYNNTELQECTRCGVYGATVTCSKCHQPYHGYRCSYLRMAKDYKNSLVCLRCLKSNISEHLSDTFLDKVDSNLMKQNIYKKINRDMFYENPELLYTPQLEDIVYFMPQGYEEAVGYYPYHFITGEPERNGPIESYFNEIEPKLKELEGYIKWQIVDMKYFLPSATTYEMNRKLQTQNQEFSILTELSIKVCQDEEAKNI